MFRKLFLLLTLFASLLFFYPYLHYQNILSQEDHGRDLYTFAQIAHGKHIYKDMWWEYGPLMPYYYGLFNLLFGLKIPSVLLGKFILNILACLFFYLASCEVMSVSWAFLASCFFMLQQEDFFYTYNHLGGIVLFLMLLWLIFKQRRQNDPSSDYLILGVCLMIGFIKINFGVTALLATLLLKPTSRPKIFYLTGLLIVPLIWIGTFYFLLNGLTATEINQCLPYFGSNHSIIATPLQSIKGYLNQNYINFLKDWLAFLDAAILATQTPAQLLNLPTFLMSSIAILKLLIYPVIYMSILIALGISITKEFKSKRRGFWLIQLTLWIFIILNFHEFIVSNTFYRSFWSQPFILFYFFLMVSTAVSFAPPRYRYLIGGLFISLFILVTLNTWIMTKNQSTPDKYLTASTGEVYLGNNVEWIRTVNDVTNYLNRNFKKNEFFLTMPCDSLFYYLTDKPSPTRQTIFYNSFHITRPQELSIIQELEKNKVNYVLLSSRVKTSSPELGEFGKTYCPLLYQYVMNNFTEVHRFGVSWNTTPGWADNLALMLLKRRAKHH